MKQEGEAASEEAGRGGSGSPRGQKRRHDQPGQPAAEEVAAAAAADEGAGAAGIKPEALGTAADAEPVAAAAEAAGSPSSTGVCHVDALADERQAHEGAGIKDEPEGPGAASDAKPAAAVDPHSPPSAAVEAACAPKADEIAGAGIEAEGAAGQVRDPTTWTVLQHDGPDRLELWYNALRSIKWP